MEQELFNGIARGDLPVLAITLLGARIPSDDDVISGVISPSLITAVDPMLAQAQWIALLAHLSQTARRCAQPEVTNQLKPYGIRRAKTVVNGLAREYVRAWNFAASKGFVRSVNDVLCMTHTMPRHNLLTEDFRTLAETYRLLLWVMAPRNGGQLFRWLSERASVHAAQAEAVQ
jgi:hypothetical protein